MIAFVLPGMRLRSLLNAREHWAQRAGRAKHQRSTARVVAQAHGVHLAALPLDVTITRCGPGTLDDDNATASAKHVRDGIADAIGIDDRDPRVRWTVRQERAKTWSVRVEIAGRAAA